MNQSTKSGPAGERRDAGDGSGNCWNCSASLTHLDYGRAERCEKCGRDTRVCKGCVHYDARQNNECRESSADRVVEKERSNFCDYFRPASNIGSTKAVDARQAALAAAEALFKKKT